MHSDDAENHDMGSQIQLREGTQLQMKVNTAAYARAIAGLPGLDVSSHQGHVDWANVVRLGAQFAYVKATEGSTYVNPYFRSQYDGSAAAGLIRGAWHFARPDKSSGTDQADRFVDNGGGWSNDGKTLPGAVVIAYNPYGPTCYGFSQPAMAGWIGAFSNEYHLRTGRWPVIYTSTSWWKTCVGSAGQFSVNSPLWIARYARAPGALPDPWQDYTFWQFAVKGTFPGEQNLFNGSYSQLQKLAHGDVN